MMPVLFGSLLQYVFGFALTFTGVFLIMLVLVQRGRGGGLTGALGGVGGQSAFGTKAGDLFTRITVVFAVVWIFLCMATIILLNGGAEFQPSSTRMTGPFSRDAGDPGGTDGAGLSGEGGAATDSGAPEGAAPPSGGGGAAPVGEE
jgi:preprotein translocase subunit SecG